jgi:heme-degrading monooxygenase HmoA
MEYLLETQMTHAITESDNALNGGWPTPYYAVIFTSIRTQVDEGYAETAAHMLMLAATMPGYLGVDSAREAVGITVSYWQDLASIAAWKQVSEHRAAQRLGRAEWYQAYNTRIARVEREYAFSRA